MPMLWQKGPPLIITTLKPKGLMRLTAPGEEQPLLIEATAIN